MGDDRDDSALPLGEFPELELEDAPPRQRAAPVVSGAFDGLSDDLQPTGTTSADFVATGAAQEPTGLYSGDGLDDLADDGPGARLDLASYPPPAALVARPPAFGVEPLPEPELDRVHEVAGYGPAPTSPLQAPVYALRVLMRRRELRRRLGSLDLASRDAERAVTGVLAAIGRALVPTLSGNERYASLLEPAAALERAAAEVTAAVGTVERDAAASAEEFRRARAELAARIEAASARQTEAEELLADAELDLKRTEAKQKRILIEARNLRQGAEHAAGGAGKPIAPAHASQIAELEAKAGADAPLAAAQRTRVEAARRALHASRQEIAQLNAEQKRLDADERGVQGQKGAALEAEIARQREAADALEAAQAELTRAVLAARDVTLDPAELAKIQAAESRLQAARVEQDCHVRALDAHDPDSVRRGLVILGVVAGALLLLLVILL